jgi:anti-sigma factor RsiW
MKCEEFEAVGLDAERDGSLSELERVAAREHAGTCSRCAGLQDSWEAARVELHDFADATAAAETPARVEMRLRHEFRMRHRTVKTRRTAVIAAWALAAAALVVGAVSWRNWRMSLQDNAAGHAQTSQTAGNLSNGTKNAGTNSETPLSGVSGTQHSNAAENDGNETLVADNEMNDFTLLPGVLQSEVDDAAILRVRMQRGTLGALGLPVNEDRAGEWIQVDLLVANDGLPQAVRLPQ